jgi:pyruvate/2-oxoglutarate dehydrogenase complex dihydrolipoamide dehydrogenase (E3) component
VLLRDNNVYIRKRCSDDGALLGAQSVGGSAWERINELVLVLALVFALQRRVSLADLAAIHVSPTMSLRPCLSDHIVGHSAGGEAL